MVRCDVITPAIGWVTSVDGQPAAIIGIFDPVLVEGEQAWNITLLVAPAKGAAPRIVKTTTADTQLSPGAQPKNVLIPVAEWLGTHRYRDANHTAITAAALTLLGLPPRSTQ